MSGQAYQQVCDELLACFDDPKLTFSARILRSMIEEGIRGTGRALADRYRTQLREEPLEDPERRRFYRRARRVGGATEESGS